MIRINDPAQSDASENTASQHVAQSLRDAGARAKDLAQEQVNQIRQSASEYYEQGREAANRWEQKFEDYVRERPVKSILVAAGIGVILGILWRRS